VNRNETKVGVSLEDLVLGSMSAVRKKRPFPERCEGVKSAPSRSFLTALWTLRRRETIIDDAGLRKL
jgi:hypothetical protein